MKYLGIYLDGKFNFNAHIDHTVTKLITLLNMLARTAMLQWGVGHKAIKIIYEEAVVPILTYGAPMWVEAIWKNKNLTKYKRIQRLITIKTTQAYRTILRDSWSTTHTNNYRAKDTNLYGQMVAERGFPQALPFW